MLRRAAESSFSNDPQPTPPAHAGAAFSDFAQLILDISRSFVNLPQVEVDAGIDRALGIIAQFAGAQRCYIYEFSDADMTMDCIHEWCAPGVESHRGWTRRMPLSDIPWIAYALRRGDVLSIPSLACLPPEAEIDRRTLERTGLPSFAFVPMFCCSSLTGFLGLGPLPAEPARQDETLALLRVAAEMFSNALEQKKSERDRRVAEWLHDILTIMNSTKPLEEILSHMVTRAGQLLEADAAVIFRVDTAGKMLTIEALCDMPADCTLGLRLPYGDAEPMTSIARGQPFAVVDFADRLASVQRQPEDFPPEFMAWIELMARHFAAYVATPLIIQDAPYGMLVVYYRTQRQIISQDIRLAMSVAHQAALAIESARLRERAEQTAVVTERSRLSRELHDSVTQSLYSVTLWAEAATRLLRAGNMAEASAHLSELRDTAQEALREMRLLIYELRPPALEKSGLAGALQARLDAVEGRGGILTDLHVEGAPALQRLPMEMQRELYQIAQEALNNIVKHARAHHVWVAVLHGGAEGVRLEIRDDGVGFEPAAVRSHGGLGLSGIEERCGRIHGQLEIDSVPGQGTRVAVWAPAGYT